jgi:hypothetical protein
MYSFGQEQGERERKSGREVHATQSHEGYYHEFSASQKIKALLSSYGSK